MSQFGLLVNETDTHVQQSGKVCSAGRSYVALNAANFCQAEMLGVILPVLSAYLKEANWRYDAIGLATASAGLGTLLLQTPAGWLTDKTRRRRMLFVSAALITGGSFAALPAV